MKTSTRKPTSTPKRSSKDFTALVEAVRGIHEACAVAVARTVNITLTLRNWLIGAYIHHYELHGADRAEYGDRLIPSLAKALHTYGVPTTDPARLYVYIAFYRTYPHIAEAVSLDIASPDTHFHPGSGIFPTLSGKSSERGEGENILRTASGKSRKTSSPSKNTKIVPTGSGPSSISEVFDMLRSMAMQWNTAATEEKATNGRQRNVRIVEALIPRSDLPPRTLIERLSFSHFAELLEIDDPLKRAFYEVECVRGNWSVRALKRQIASLYFERSGLSKDKKKLSAMADAVAGKAEPRLAIRDPYVFEFLGLRAQDAVAETDLESALLDSLPEFLMELGHGFCLEARQKSILLGKTRGYVDLVFYHRVLKCHVLIELKTDAFSHEHLGQLNTYVTYYRKHMMTEGDNPPIGLLLCTQKDHALVEYAVAGLDNRLFVSKYQVELPTKEELERFLLAKRREITEG